MEGADYPAFSVAVPKSFLHRFASVFQPQSMPTGMGGTPKFSCCFPASELPAGMGEWLGVHDGYAWRPAVRERDGVSFVTARSPLRPVVVPGLVPGQDSWWRHQLDQCDALNLPRDWLLRHLRLELVVKPYEWASDTVHFKRHGIQLSLKAVVVCDPSDDSAIKAIMEETRASAREGRKR